MFGRRGIPRPPDEASLNPYRARFAAMFARLRHKPDPGMVDYRKLVPLSFSIFLVLVVFGVMLILADIVNPVSIG